MESYKKILELETKEPSQIIDITDDINKIIKESKLNEGTILIKVCHTTVGVFINEHEANLVKDFIEYLNKQAPKCGEYKHDDIETRKDCPHDEPINAHSHLKANMFSQPSLVWYFTKGQLDLGKYQRVLFGEFDGPCPRKYKEKRKITILLQGN